MPPTLRLTLVASAVAATVACVQGVESPGNDGAAAAPGRCPGRRRRPG